MHWGVPCRDQSGGLYFVAAVVRFSSDACFAAEATIHVGPVDHSKIGGHETSQLAGVVSPGHPSRTEKPFATANRVVRRKAGTLNGLPQVCPFTLLSNPLELGSSDDLH